MMILQMSLSGTALIIVMILLRLCMRYHFSGRYRLIFWGITVLCLLVPFRIQSDFSIYQFLKIPQEIRVQPDQNSMEAFSAETAAAFSADLSGKESDLFHTIFPAETQNNRLLGNLWLIGVILCLGFFVISYLRCLREFKMSFPVQTNTVEIWKEQHPCRRGLEIRESGCIQSPMTYGILHPVILMPKSFKWTNMYTVSLILEHEYVHVRHFDAATKLLLTFVLCIHWFNPLVWLMYSLANRDLESACDEQVIRHCQGDIRADYARVLLSLEESKSGFVTVGNSFRKNAIEERIVAIMKYKKTSAMAVITAGIIMGTATIVFATSASEPKKMQESAYTSEYSSENIPESDKISSELYEKNYKIYEPFGVSYDEEGACLVFDGKRVGYFIDEIEPGCYRRFLTSTDDSTVGVRVMRDEAGEIHSLISVPVPQPELASASAAEETVIIGGVSGPVSVFIAGKHQTEAKSDDEETINMENIGIAEMDASSERGDTTLEVQEDYQQYGITASNTSGANAYWMYNGKGIAALYDDNGSLFTDENGTAYLHVIRDKSGKIQEIEEISKEQINKMLMNNG